MLGIINNRNHKNMDCISRYCPSTINRLIGKIRRNKGFYDNSTLLQLSTAYKKQPSIKNLIAYLRFQRDLGCSPSPQHLKDLSNNTKNIPRKLLRNALNLLIENDMLEQVLQATDHETLKLLADKSPPIAHALHKNKLSISAQAQTLAKFHDNQERNRNEFFEYLNKHLSSICIVGNAATLTNAGNGNLIDEHDIVVRFNHYQSKKSKPKDIGEKINIWVCSPTIATSTMMIPDSVEWIVLSGCDVRYQLSNWHRLIPLIESNRKIITIPIGIWQNLVEALHAPPSAGLIFLSWLLKRLDQPNNLATIGFQVNGESQGNPSYHHAIPSQKPGHRHNWKAERKQLSTWIDKDLILMDRSQS